MSIPGLDAAYAEVSVFGAVHQNRFAARLQALGPPGAARWDPGLGEVELRGHTFRAEQLGSYDGRSWMWSWANPHLALPDDKTVMARSLRDSTLDVPARLEQEIFVQDERLPFMVASLAIGHCGAEGYYIASQSQVYGIAPGQVPALEISAVEELHQAMLSLLPTPMPHNMPVAVRFAAKQLGLEVVEEERSLVVQEGRKALRIALSKLGPTRRTSVLFAPKSLSFEDALQRVKAKSDVPIETLESSFVVADDDFEVHVNRSERLGTVMSEAKRLPTDVDAARKYGAVFVLETAVSPSYAGALYAPTFGAWAPVQMLKLAPGSPTLIGPAMAVQGAIVEGLNDWLIYDCALGRVSRPR